MGRTRSVTTPETPMLLLVLVTLRTEGEGVGW